MTLNSILLHLGYAYGNRTDLKFNGLHAIKQKLLSLLAELTQYACGHYCH
jgi:hypothetical protein